MALYILVELLKGGWARGAFEGSFHKNILEIVQQEVIIHV